MATPRDIRRLAFQILYQLDARGGDDADAVLASISVDEEETAKFTEGERKKAFLFATEAFAQRKACDDFLGEAAPSWPVHRLAAVDRSILRLSYYEMASGRTHPRIVVNEAVELAKAFSTEKSPSFINGLLDKVLKKVLGESGADQPAPPEQIEAQTAESNGQSTAS